MLLCAGLPVMMNAAPNPATTPEGRHSLAVAELHRVAGPALEKMNSSSETRWFVEDLQKSPERMADLMLSGPLEDPAKSLRILAALWKADPKGLQDRHEATTAAAVALIFAKAKWPEDKALDSYKLASAAGQRVADFPNALAEAKKSKSNIAVFVHGSDWNRPGEAVAKIWNDPRFPPGLGGKVVLVDMDRKENPTEADKALAKLNEKGNPPVRSIPAVALYDNEGRLVGYYSGGTEIDGAGGVLAATRKLLVTCRERDECWSSANGASGMMKAGRLAQGLDRMNLGLGPKDVYKPVLEAMRKADPEDKSGYIAKYTFSSEKLVDLAIDSAKNGDFTNADKELGKWDACSRLSPRQKQELQGARFALYQRWPEKKQDLKPVLEKMRDIDPASELGLAAARYIEMLSPKGKKGEPQASARRKGWSRNPGSNMTPVVLTDGAVPG